LDRDPKFDVKDFENSQRVMKCARQLFPNPKDQESWALLAYERWQSKGITPEKQRDLRSPHWRQNLETVERRQQTKVLYYE